MIFDSHCHYNLEPLFSEWKKHWTKAQENGVAASIVVGTDSESNKQALAICESDPHLFAAIGIHPGETLDSSPVLAEELRNFLSHPKVKAVGETGLDYFHLKRDLKIQTDQKKEIISRQQEIFRQQIKLAQEFQLPLLLHVRDTDEQAYWDVLKALEEEKYLGKFVLHCASGPVAYIQAAVKMGAYIGVAGNVTYPSAEHIREIVRMTPQNRVLIETDAPFLPPQGFRGQMCEPWMISQTAAFLEKELGLGASTLWENAQRFFGLD